MLLGDVTVVDIAASTPSLFERHVVVRTLAHDMHHPTRPHSGDHVTDPLPIQELGRRWVLQISLGLVNLWQIPCALAPNFGTILAFRALGGLSSAGGSVTLGMVADMWEPEDHQYAVAFVVLSSVCGSVIAPIAGGFISKSTLVAGLQDASHVLRPANLSSSLSTLVLRFEIQADHSARLATYLDWPWVFWISLIFGAVAQLMHCWVPETRRSTPSIAMPLEYHAFRTGSSRSRTRPLHSTSDTLLTPHDPGTDVMLDNRAKYLRKSGEDVDAYGPIESRGSFRERVSVKEMLLITWRPFKFLITEPIVTFLSLLSGFSDALIFTGLDSFPLVLSKWNFSTIQVGLAFIALLVGCKHCHPPLQLIRPN